MSTDAIRNYHRMLLDVSAWFRTVQAKHAAQMRCGQGCSRCCYGLFDISLPDAICVTSGLRSLPGATRTALMMRAAGIQRDLCLRAPELHPPYLLAMTDEAIIDRIAGLFADARCPFLDADDTCLVYDHRPLACRLEGLPMVDQQDGLFSDWCPLNFTGGISPEATADLRWDYYGLQAMEQRLAAELSEMLLGERQEQVATLVPSLIVECETLWIPLLSKLESAE